MMYKRKVNTSGGIKTDFIKLPIFFHLLNTLYHKLPKFAIWKQIIFILQATKIRQIWYIILVRITTRRKKAKKTEKGRKKRGQSAFFTVLFEYCVSSLNIED